jgi:carboxyl-terminal processing protease
MRFIKSIVVILAAAALLGGTFAFGFYFGKQKLPAVEKVTTLINKENKEAVATTDFEPFWEVWQILDNKHPKASEINDQDRVWGAVKGLASSLDDPYTVFFPPDEAKAFAENINGEFGGIGIEIGFKDGALTVIAPLKNSPAEAAGLKTGDIITAIDKVSTENMSIDRAVRLIRGEKGTEVVLSIYREGKDGASDYPIIRDTIKVPVLETETKDGVFIIKLFNFSANSPDLFRRALEEFSKAKTNKLILDLRGNPGGFLEASIDMASWFLPAGKTVVIENIGKEGKEKIHRSKGYDVFTKNLRMMILVDGGSASASEILAGALKEHGVAKLVGEKTYGKGSVQELIDTAGGTSLKVTIAEWLTPNKVEISKNGLTPDVVVKKTENAKDSDAQLAKALELLK